MAVTTGKIGICNAALIRLGEITIVDFTEASLQATACSLLWDSSRREMLQSHPWNFAIARSSWTAATESGGLARTASATPVNKEYKYEYTLPTDCIKLLKVYYDYDYKVEGRLIMTDTEECHIKYVTDIEDTTLFTPMFRKVMESKMAYELAYTVVRGEGMITQMYTLLERNIEIAKAMDSQEDISDPIDQFESSFITTRYSGRGR